MQAGSGRLRQRVLLAVLGLSVLAGLGAAGFAEYQGSRDALHARAGHLVSAEVTPAGADPISTCWTLRLQGSNGLAPAALIRVPRGGTPPYPTGVLMGGLNRGRRVVNVHGLEGIARGAVLLSLDYPLGHGPRGSSSRIMATAAQLRPAGLDTIASILLALDYLESRGDVDRRRLFLVGASLGAPAVTIAGAVDERPAAVIALYGGGHLGSLVARTLQHPDHRHVYPRWQAVVLGQALAWWLTPLDPVHYAGRIAPRPYLMVNGDDDSLIPPGNVEAVFAAAHEPKTLMWVAGEHIEPDEGRLIERVAGQVSDWLATRGLLPRSVAPAL